MLPGAEIEFTGSPGEIVALVDDLDGPIPVLVERGGYALRPVGSAPDERRLQLQDVELTLVASREAFTALVGGEW
jgi:hypothetical protein